MGGRRRLWAVDGGGDRSRALGGHRSLPRVPYFLYEKGEGEGGDLLLTFTVSVDHRSPFVVVTVHPLLVAMSPTATWRLLLV